MKFYLVFLLLVSTTARAESDHPPLEREGSVSIYGSFLSIRESLFLEQENSSAEKGTTTNLKTTDRLTNFLQAYGGRFTHGKTLHRSASEKLSQENGDFILVSSRANITEYESTDNLDHNPNLNNTPGSDNDYFSSTNKLEIKKGNKKLEYLGTVSKYGTYPESIDQSLTYIETHDFDPCSLEQRSTALIKGALEELDSQGKQSLEVNCVLGEKLNGHFFADVVFTDLNGEIIRKIELTGDLTLQVSKALTLKYGQSYLKGSDPFDYQYGTQLSQQQINSPIPQGPFQYFGPGLEVGNIYFIDKEQIQGKIHEFEAIHSSESKNTDCSLDKTFNLKLEENRDGSLKDERLYRFNIVQDCGSKGSTEVKLSNAYEKDGEQAVVFSFEKNSKKTTDSEALKTRFNVDVANTVESNEWFLNFNLTHRVIEATGKGSETGFDVFYAQDEDSYVVAKHILISPIYDSKKFEELSKKARKEKKPLNLKDADLCFKIDCQSLGAAITFKEDGGAFISAEGESIVEAFGKELNFTVSGGIGLNDEAENEGFGSGSFFNNDSENFVELKVEAPGCKKSFGGCAALGIRKEETSTKLIFGASIKF